MVGNADRQLERGTCPRENPQTEEVPLAAWRDKYRHIEIVLATLVAAAAVGGLSFYIFEKADAGVIGAGSVTALGFWIAAHFAKDRDRVWEPRFTMALLLELFVAFALAFRGFEIVGWSRFFELNPGAPAYVCFYAIKLFLSYITRSFAAQNRKQFRRLSVAAYVLLVVITSGLTYDGWGLLDGAPLWFGAFFVFWTSCWFTVPTVTFVLDLRAGEGPPLRHTVWRSVLEILFVSPLFNVFASFVWAIVMLSVYGYPL